MWELHRRGRATKDWYVTTWMTFEQAIALMDRSWYQRYSFDSNMYMWDKFIIRKSH